METRFSSLDEVISDCIMNITDFNPTTNTKVIGALRNQTVASFKWFDQTGRVISDQTSYMLTGSVAELRIKTALPCFGDSDFMMYFKRFMVTRVTPFGTAVPSKECLRKFGSKAIEMYSYHPTTFAGYVHLDFLGNLSFDKEADSISFTCYKHFLSDSERDLDKFSVKTFYKTDGPAIKVIDNTPSLCEYHKAYSFKSIDVVPCVFYPHWPPEARDFSERNRQHGWPTRSTIEEIVSLGCDFVQVCHPLHKTKELKHQWRFSFSRAEIILIHTWSNTQKIVYHLLRYLNKNTKMFEDHVICTYHLKTLMLWNCEKRPPEYWDRHRLIHIVADALHELRQCAQANRLQSYFIPESNISFKKRDDACGDSVNETECYRKRLWSVEVGDLIDWFLRNYLYVAAAKCPQNEFKEIVLDLGWENTFINDRARIKFFTEVLQSEYSLAGAIHQDLDSSLRIISSLYELLQLRQTSCRYALRLLKEADGRLVNFFRACILLHAAQKIADSKQLPNHWLFDVILDAVNDFGDADERSWEFPINDVAIETAESYFNKALIILRMFADKRECEANVLLLELAKCCLRKTLEHDDSLAVSSAAVVYLAMISYKQRLYEEAINLCMLVIEHPCVPGTRGIDCDLTRAFDMPSLSAFVGFTDLLFNLHTDRKSVVKTDAIECSPMTVAILLLKDHLVSSNSSVAERAEKILTNLLENHDIGRQASEHLNQSKRNSINGNSNRLILMSVVAFAKKFNDLHGSSKVETVIYSRRSVQPPPKISDDLFNSLLDLSARYLTKFRRSVREDLEPSKNYVNTDQYLALNSLRLGDYATALKISEEMIACYAQSNVKCTVTETVFHAIVSPPFHLLLDDKLKMLLSIDEAKHSSAFGQQFIDTKALALHIRSECLSKLGMTVPNVCPVCHKRNG